MPKSAKKTSAPVTTPLTSPLLSEADIAAALNNDGYGHYGFKISIDPTYWYLTLGRLKCMGQRSGSLADVIYSAGILLGQYQQAVSTLARNEEGKVSRPGN